MIATLCSNEGTMPKRVPLMCLFLPLGLERHIRSQQIERRKAPPSAPFWKSPSHGHSNGASSNGACLVVHHISLWFLALFRRGVVLGRTSLVPTPLPQGGEPLAGGAGPGVLRPKRLFADGKRASVERQGFLLVSLLLPQHARSWRVSAVSG